MNLDLIMQAGLSKKEQMVLQKKSRLFKNFPLNFILILYIYIYFIPRREHGPSHL